MCSDLGDDRFIANSDVCGEDADDVDRIPDMEGKLRHFSMRTSHPSRVAMHIELFETVGTVRDSKHCADFTMNTIQLQEREE